MHKLCTVLSYKCAWGAQIRLSAPWVPGERGMPGGTCGQKGQQVQGVGWGHWGLCSRRGTTPPVISL